MPPAPRSGKRSGDAPGGVPAGRPLTIGVLGGIASGKSLAASLLAGERGLVVDADREARELLESPEGLGFLRESFGPWALDAAGEPDRTALAERVFSDPEARSRLEDWTHPRVRARIAARLEAARAAGLERVVLDVPLLLENDARHGLAGLSDVLVFVDADASERDRRAVRDRNWQPGEVARREALQTPLEEKRARADFTLPNGADRAALEAHVERILDALDHR